MRLRAGMSDHEASIPAKRASRRPRLRLRLKHRLGLLDEMSLATYAARGRADWLRVKGRVVETAALVKPGEDNRRIHNAWNTVRRLTATEVGGARVTARFRGVTGEAVSDAEGYFTLRLDMDAPVEPGWHEVDVEAREPLGGRRLETRARVLVPRPDARFAVVSDIDDTVIRTHATAFWGQVRMSLGRNARTRPRFPGVVAFYRALQRGPEGHDDNPIFYVSRSGWNLYDLYEDFMAHHGIPPGPFFMTDLRIVERRSQALGHDAPKLERCGILLENYGDTPFVLIGDSGQHDPETYREVVDRHPNRVKAIYIRQVTSGQRAREVEAIADELAEHGVAMILAEDTVAAAEHAAEHDLIAPGAVDEVREEVERERGRPAPP